MNEKKMNARCMKRDGKKRNFLFVRVFKSKKDIIFIIFMIFRKIMFWTQYYCNLVERNQIFCFV